MARETKVGLVVGLGFIACFAMILANRGGVDRIPAQMPYQLFGSPSPPAVQPAAARGVEDASESSRPPRAAQLAEMPSWESAVLSENKQEEDDTAERIRPAPTVIPDPERFTRRRRPNPNPLDPAESVLAQSTTGASLAARHDLTLHDEGQGMASDGPAEDPSEEPSATSANALPASLAPYADQFVRADPRSPSSPLPELIHTAEKGDSLSRIARLYYGSSSHAAIDAIYQANRGELRSPDQIAVGTRLRLPAVGDLSPRPPTDPEPEQAVAEVSEPQQPEPPAFRTYKVAKGDRLGTIAKKHLGSSNRWREILELNKDIFTDARRLPTGAEIRIPLNTVADAR